MNANHTNKMMAFLSIILLPLILSAQPVVGISSIPNVYFGYKIGPVTPIVGVNIMYHENEYSTTEYIGIPDYSFYYEYSVLVYNPVVGVKLNLSENMINPYLFFGIGKDFPDVLSSKGNIEENDIEDDYDDMNFRLSFGAEYFLNDKISIGGEVGINGFFHENENSESNHFYTSSNVNLAYYLGRK